MIARYNGLADWHDARFVALWTSTDLEDFEEPADVPIPHSLAVRARST